MNGEAGPASGPEHEGEKYLRLLGLEHLANLPLPGTDVLGRNFLDICGNHPETRPSLVGLASLSPDDPRFGRMRRVLRERISEYVNLPLAEE